MSYSFKNLAGMSKEKLVKILWKDNPQIHNILQSSTSIMDARMRVSTYLNNMENQYFHLFSDEDSGDITLSQRNHAKESIRVLKNIIRVENENAANFSSLEQLFRIAKGDKQAITEVSPGFICEFIYMFLGMHGKGVKSDVLKMKDARNKKGREAAIIRSFQLDEYSQRMQKEFKKYKSGLSRTLTKGRKRLRDKIIAYFGGTKKDWDSFDWQVKHIIKDKKTIEALVKLEPAEQEGLELAEKYGIDVHITPYYLSLFNESGKTIHDRVIRAQVLPSVHYCEEVNKNRTSGLDLDFMGEKNTSPIDCITRRYPQILILKPFDACPQICVYCQRNWEIKDVDETCVTQSKVDEAIQWIADDNSITEVLVTGGDPLTLNNKQLDQILGKLAAIKHVERIRIGSRILVTAPCRIDDGLLEVLDKYHEFGRREICMMTHFEHAMEITNTVKAAVGKVRRLGINIYNQQVFTYYNSRRFETCFLRKKLKVIGIDPYYCFNTKGKEETKDYRVPIARIEQEVKEEARLMPGLTRTDEPVFNVPMLGKSHLRAWQDHEPVMINREGCRVYRFFPWEVNVANQDSYIYTDVSVYDYLTRLIKDKERVDMYQSIWFYF